MKIFAWRYFIYKLTKVKMRNILSMIFAVFSFPILALGGILRSQDYNITEHYFNNNNSIIILTACVVLFIFSISVMYFLLYSNGILNFNYLNKHSAVDVSYSLPINTKTRFWADFLTGLLPTTVCYILSFALGLLMLVCFKTPELEEIIRLNENWGFIIGLLLSGLIFFIMSYCFVVFVTSICGRVFEASVYPIIIACVLPGIITIVLAAVFKNVWTIDIAPLIIDAITVISPAGFVIGTAASVSNAYAYLDIANNLPVFRAEIMIPLIISTVIIVMLSYYFNKRRKPEKVGEAFTVKYAYNIILSAVIFAVTSMFILAMTNINIAVVVISTAIIYLLMEVITKRRFNKPLRSLIRYAALVTGSFALTGILILTKGFGSGNYIPELDEIESVKMSASFHNYVQGDMSGYIGETIFLEFNEAEEIKLIRDAHYDYLNTDFEDYFYNLYFQGNYYDANYNITEYVTYTLNNGKKITRNILIRDEWFLKLQPLLSGNDYKEKYFAIIDEKLKKENRLIEYTFAPITDNYSWFNYGGVNEDFNISLQIYEALKKDVFAENIEDAYNSTTAPLFALSFSVGEKTRHGYNYSGRTNFYIKSSYTNLLSVLEKNNITVPIVKKEDFENRIIFLQKNVESKGSYYIRLNELLLNDDERAWELFSVMQPNNLPSESRFYIVTPGNMLRIPPQYAEIANELFEEQMAAGNYSQYPDWNDYSDNYISENQYFENEMDKITPTVDIEF